MIDFAQSQADRNIKEAPTAEKIDCVQINPQALKKSTRAKYNEVRKSHAALVEQGFKLIECRNESRPGHSRPRKRTLVIEARGDDKVRVNHKSLS
jgi:hypothetical protein